jgi:hypothetical protein
MRAALLLLVAPAIARADVRAPDVMRRAHPVATTGFSHVLYLNNCLPDGCTVTPGEDDALTQHSSIPTSPAHIPGWPWGASAWSALVSCVAATYAPFDVTITATDPGDAPHFEILVGGTGADLDPQTAGAGGVAPFIPCNGEIADSVMTFVFAAETSQLDYLCGAVAQESSHVWGLDHELDANDPMTYLDLGTHKSFQDAAADCGESTPRQCFCGDTQQNSYQYLAATFGLARFAAPAPARVSPTDRALADTAQPAAGGCSTQPSPALALCGLAALLRRRRR